MFSFSKKIHERIHQIQNWLGFNNECREKWKVKYDLYICICDFKRKFTHFRNSDQDSSFGL